MILRISSIDWSLEQPPLKGIGGNTGPPENLNGQSPIAHCYKLGVGKLQAIGGTRIPNFQMGVGF